MPETHHTPKGHPNITLHEPPKAMPTDIEGLSDEDLLDEYAFEHRLWHEGKSSEGALNRVEQECLTRMSGAGWRSVGRDGLPPEEEVWQAYLVAVGGMSREVAIWKGAEQSWMAYPSGDNMGEVTHYRPLPNPPEEG